MRGEGRNLARLLLLAFAGGLVFATPAFADCPTYANLDIGPLTTTDPLNNEFDSNGNSQFTIVGKVAGDGLHFGSSVTPGDNIVVRNQAGVDSTAGSAGAPGIQFSGEFNSVCYIGAEAADIASSSVGVVVDEGSDGDISLDVAHRISGDVGGMLISHVGDGDIEVATSDIFSLLGPGVTIVRYGDGRTAVTTNGAIDSGGPGVVIQTAGSGPIDILTGHDVDAFDVGIVVVHGGATGDVNITTAPSTSIKVATGDPSPGPSPFDRGTGIYVDRFYSGAGQAGGDVHIENGADIVSDGVGIDAGLCSCAGTGTVQIDSLGNITAPIGIYVESSNHTAIDVQRGKINGGDAGIVSDSDSTSLTIGRGTTVSASDGDAVDIYGVANIRVAGTLVGSDNAIYTSDGATQLTLQPGYSIKGPVDLDPAYFNKLTFGGADGSAAFDLSAIDHQYLNVDSLTKTGNSLWTLSGSSFSGLITADAGTLKVNSPIPGLDIILHGTGTLGGNGTIKSLTTVGGTIAPGNSIGTVTVVGNAGIGAGTTYAAEVNAAGKSDRLIAGGDVSIDPSAKVVALPEPGIYKLGTKYVIVTAGGAVNGVFAGVTSASPFFDASLSYDAQNVWLTLDRNAITLASQGTTPNQKAVAASLDQLGAGAPYFNQLVVLTAAGVPAALDALSGDAYLSTVTAAIDESRYLRDATLDRLARDPATGSGLWGRTYGGLTVLPGDGNGPGIDSLAGGVIGGVDAEAGALRVGALASFGRTALSAPSRDLTGAGNDISLGVYGAEDWDKFYLSFGATLTRRDLTSTRDIAFAGGDTYSANFGGTTAQAFGEAGVTIDAGAAKLTPFAGLALIHARRDGFTETGTGPAALTVGAATGDAALLTLGLRLEHDFVLGDDMAVALSTSAAWRHAIGGTTTGSSTLPGGTPFALAGTTLPADALLLAASAGFDVGEDLELSIDYSGVLAMTGGSHAVTATLSGSF